jgi:hypothetical protein
MGWLAAPPWQNEDPLLDGLLSAHTSFSLHSVVGTEDTVVREVTVDRLKASFGALGHVISSRRVLGDLHKIS